MANNLTVTYKGNTIHTASASGSATLETGKTWCEDDIGLSYTFDGGGSPFTLVVSVADGAFVTASDGTHTVTGTSASGACTLQLPNAGTWSVYATKSGQSTGTATVDVEDIYNVTLLFVSAVLNDNDWSTIRQVSDSNDGANYWAIGDRKEVTLNGTVGQVTFSSYSTYVYIIGFNHNSAYEGTQRIHFSFAFSALNNGANICYTDSSYNSGISSTGYFSMNATASNNGGWASSQMRNNICGTSLTSYTGTLIGAIPSTLRNVLKSVVKYTDNVGGGTNTAANVTGVADYIFLLAEFEVAGVRAGANTNEKNYQQQYAYYSSGNSPIRYVYNGITTAARWWFRSPNSSSTTDFRYLHSNGNGAYGAANYSRGFAPCFCV